MITCNNCGAKNAEGSNFCQECGVSLEKSVDENLEQDITEKTGVTSDNSGKIVALDLTPAESLMILQENKGIITKQLLKVTFIDLVFKNVFTLDVQEVEKRGLFGKKLVKKYYLKEGKNFNLPLKPHEEVFRKHLPRKANSKRFKKLQQRVFKKYKYNYSQKLLLEPLAQEGYFNEEKKFLRKEYSLSDKGREAQEIILQLKEEGKDLDEWLESDPEKAKAYILMGGSNIFLTDDYYMEWFKNNSKKIGQLLIGVAVAGLVYKFSRIRWYSAFKHSGDFDFDEFDSWDDDFVDIFSDDSTFDSFDIFDTVDFDDFDSGFDDGGDDSGWSD